MRIIILAAAFGFALTGVALAQTASPVAPPASTSAPGQDIDVRPIRLSCRDEATAKGLKDQELREAVRACVQAKLPEGYAMNGRPGPKMVREACRSEVDGQGLKGPDRRAAVQKCFAEKRPDLAKAEACRKDAKDKGLQGDDFREAVKACRSAA